jgi:Tol biopolymer transport system component
VKLLHRSIPFLLPIALLVLAACSVLNSPSRSATQTAAAVPTSTFPPELATQDLRLVSPRSCLTAQFTSINTQSPQGDLMAWSPSGDLLALDLPENGHWGWFLGDATIYDVPANKEVFATQGDYVFGDLTWSPAGDYLAFVKYSADAHLYTVVSLRLQDHSLVDYFPGASAHTDDFSSLKGIDAWDASQSLVVTSSCGSDCVRFYSINTGSGQTVALSEKRKTEDQSLQLKNQLTSPDGRLKVINDDQGMSWLTRAADGSTYLLAKDPIDEIKWSADSQYFAIRLVDQVSVYKVSCP